MTYSDKLKSPKWQKKRLEIMERDEFTCQGCANDKSMLVVHHFKYNGEPWEAENDDLITLCEDCHNQEHEYFNNRKKYFEERRFKRILEDTVKGCDLDIYRTLGSLINIIKTSTHHDPHYAMDSLEIYCDDFLQLVDKVVLERNEYKRKLDDSKN